MSGVKRSSNLFLLILVLIILIATGNENSRLLFIILLGLLAFGANGQLDFIS